MNINQISKEYIPSDIDFKEYFEDIIGVTFTDGIDIIKLKLQIDNSLWPYIDSKPLHGSQKKIAQNDAYITIELSVIPNYELESLILQFSEKIMVLEPKDFKNKLHKRIKNSLDNYNCAD